MRKLLFVVVLFSGLFFGCAEKSTTTVKTDSTTVVDSTSVVLDTTKVASVDSVVK
jgi:hypothetical protein